MIIALIIFLYNFYVKDLLPFHVYIEKTMKRVNNLQFTKVLSYCFVATATPDIIVNDSAIFFQETGFIMKTNKIFSKLK